MFSTLRLAAACFKDLNTFYASKTVGKVIFIARPVYAANYKRKYVDFPQPMGAYMTGVEPSL